MAISVNGIGQVRITLQCDPDLPVGCPCYIEEDRYVEACAEGSSFFGIVENVDDIFAAVIIRGITSVPYSGNFPGYGQQKLAADGEGGVKADENGKEYTVISADTTAKTLFILL